MKEQKKKKYEAPETKKIQVELEEGFMKASGEKQKSINLDTEVHESGETIDATGISWE